MSLSTFDRQNLNRVAPRAFRSKLGDLLSAAAAGGSYQEITTDHTLALGEGLVVALGAAAKNLTLPLASTIPAGQGFQVKVVGTGQVTFTPSGADTIDSIAGADATSKQWERRVFISNGVSAWYT